MPVLSLSLNAPDAAGATERSKFGIVAQVRLARQRRNRAAMSCGAILGGVVPLATYVVAHHEVAQRPAMGLLVLGGLVFSALSVFAFGCEAFNGKAKALGFVVLVEGTMVFSGVRVLALAALALLVGINAVSTGTRLALDSLPRRERPTVRVRRVSRRPAKSKRREPASMPHGLQWPLPLQ